MIMLGIVRTGLSMEYMVHLFIVCLEMTFYYTFVQGGDVVSPTEYLWETGDWGKCQGDQCGFGGTQKRLTWCAHTSGWTASDSNCDLMSMPDSERTCFKVCAEHAELFEWQVGTWGPCEQSTEEGEVDQPTSADQTCGERSLGKQTRKVKCVEKSTTYVQRPHESFVSIDVCKELHPEPLISQECITPCAQDCVVTHFTQWTKCTSTCGNATKTRTRRVVIPPSRGGKSCPPLSETLPCYGLPSCEGEQEYSYSFKIGPWSECERFQPEDPEEEGSSESGIPLLGMQNREVWCIQNDGTKVSFNDTGIEIPPRYQACVMSINCLVSQWADWTPCPITCPLPYGEETPPTKRTRIRHVQTLPLGAGELCPKLEEEELCQIEEGVSISSQDCPRYMWHSGGWSECKVSSVMSQVQAAQFANNSTLCGGGLHQRHVYCTELNDTELVPVPADLCEESTKPPMIEECNVECPEDCKVTEWGPWSECKTTSCSTQSYKREKGHKIRTRDVIVTQDIGGKACPHLAEFVPCDIHMCYDWHLAPTGDCVLQNSQDLCGAGLQEQQVTCIGPDKEPVSDALCIGVSLEKPASEQPCTVPCPDDCVLTEWASWTECSKSCGKGGMQSRRRTILARGKPGFRECPPEDDLMETRMCNTHSCVVFSWSTTDWTPCQNVNSAPPSYTAHIPKIPKHLMEGLICGLGRQTRTLDCVRVRNEKSSPQTRCSDLNKPPVSQQCNIPCPVDCEVSEWGQWSACPEQCPEDTDVKTAQKTYYRTRQRYITIYPLNDGAHCPQEEEREPCVIPEHCHGYVWEEGNWGLCKPVSEANGLPRENADGQQCGKGLKTRAIQCLRDDTYPFGVDMCLKYAGPMPKSSEECNLPCDDDCTFKEWGRWTNCPHNCAGDQIRKRKLIGKSRKDPKCENLDLYPVMQKRLCTCPTFSLVPVGSESDCILAPSKVSGECGFGLKFRANQCQDDRGRIMPFSYCDSDREFQESVCEVPCPYDCQLSPWSPWSDCSQVGGVGQRTRRRQILEGRKNVANGRPCPAHDGERYLYESKPCQVFNTTTVDYYWSMEPWQECWRDESSVADTNVTCGFGTQRRTVRCIMKSPTGFVAWTNQNHTMCNLDTKPEEERECRKPCPGECVVSDWTEWSNCPSDCQSFSFRHRTREVLRQPPGNGQTLCPDIMEREQCKLGTNCFEYSWNVTGWSTCELKPGAVCGEGTMMRILQCKELQEGTSGNAVDISYCEQRLPPFGEPLEVSCHVGCSMDCLLSEWSEWTKCSDVCGPDVGQIRTRKVIREASVLGRPCSPERQQKRPCKAMPCFQWLISEWTDCYSADGDCGIGMQTRNLSCVQNDGVVVEDSFCIGNKPYNSNFHVTFIGNELLERSRKCTIPCPGECQYTQWSPWSKCHIYCHVGRPIGSDGVEARSKAALDSYKRPSCPTDHVETRPCIGETCYRFTWHMGQWTLGHRDVWCQRSDSLNVSGACLADKKPSQDAECDPPCSAPHSYCSHQKQCSCMQDFEAKYNIDTGILEECREVPLNRPGVTYTQVPGYSGDGEKDAGGSQENDADSVSKRNKDKSKGEAEKNVFGSIPVWAFAVGGVFIVFILCLVTASCCACRSCRKKEEPKKKEPTDDFAIYWDETAKKRYNGEVDL